MRRLSLRTRLVLGVLALAAVALLAANAATYLSLRSFLLNQVDSSLEAGHVEVEHVYAQPLRRLDRRPGRVAAGDDLVWRDGDHLLRRAVGDRRPRRRLAGDRDPAVSSSRDEPRPTTILDVCTAASPGAIAR